MAYITTPSKPYSENESHGGVENIQNLQAAVETALGNTVQTAKLYSVDGSLFYVAADTSVYFINGKIV